MKNKKGFTLIEVLVVITVIGILSSIILPSLMGGRIKAKDARRKAEISQFGRLLKINCYIPISGAGVYDLQELIPEMIIQNPNYAEWIKQIPKDPNATETESMYKYIVDNNKNCALYTNLENSNEKVTLQNISTATPAGGTGVFQTITNGWNGTNKYFQVSN